MDIKRFDRNNASVLANEIEGELQEIAEKYGIHIRRGRGSFTITNYTLKLEISVRNSDTGAPELKEISNFKMLCKSYGLEPDDLGRTFRGDSGYIFELTGLNPRSYRYPLCVKRVPDGKVYKYARIDRNRLI